jgi:hypothetical protein
VTNQSFFVTGIHHFWQQPVEKKKQQLDEISHPSIDRSGAHSSDPQYQTVESAGLHRACRAAEQARAVAAAISIATAAAADRAACGQALYVTQCDCADANASCHRRCDGGEWGAPQRLTELALLLHAAQSAAGDTHRDVPAAHRLGRRGSRFVPDALPFHCTADYFSRAAPSGPVVAAQRI